MKIAVAATKVLSKKRSIPTPYRTAMKHPPTLFGKLAMERWLSSGRACPADLKQLATERASMLVGCVW